MNNETIAPGTATSVKDSVQHLVDQSTQTVDALKSRFGDLSEQMKRDGGALYQRAATYIRANPRKAVAIAFGVGYLGMRIRTSPLLTIAVIGVIGYFGTQISKT
jgi:ElaB/YqjD/DUF883 family membrane-anchored ribosome-binding protein